MRRPRAKKKKKEEDVDVDDEKEEEELRRARTTGDWKKEKKRAGRAGRDEDELRGKIRDKMLEIVKSRGSGKTC